jgi:transmembrane sensor
VTKRGEKQCGADSSEATEAAARWDARLRAHDCSPEERAQFQKWLHERPENTKEFSTLQRGLELLQAASATHPSLRAMRDRAAAERDRARSWRMLRAVAAILLATIGAAWIALTMQSPDPPDEAPRIASVFQTAIGERSTVQLQDGSEIALDTRSRVEVSYASDRRDIAIAEGRAYFQVAKDASRPFTVDAAGNKIVALGTQFDVRLDADYLYVTLIEGSVEVRPDWVGDNAPPPRRLVPGDRLALDREGGAVTIERADIEKVVSWKEGRILFEDTPLDKVVAEINRYSTAKIVVEDTKLAQLRVNGLFYTDHPEDFLNALTQFLPIRVRIDRTGTAYISQASAQR